MSILGVVIHAVRAYHRRRELVRTERMIALLPSEVRKDIGWPEPARTTIHNRLEGWC